MLAGRLAGRPTRANFRTGELTVCTMVPMRSVPHRVVALLGLDDDAFPRGAGVDGDDVLSRDPCVGERDRRSEDRQLLLDAVLSAGDRLLLLYTGADPVTGQERPPAVPLGELLDVVAQTAGVPPEALVRRHPLQPFDPRNVDAADPFSFDPLPAAGRAGRGPAPASRSRRWSRWPLAAAPPVEVALVRPGRVRASTRCRPSCGSGSGWRCRDEQDDGSTRWPPARSRGWPVDVRRALARGAAARVEGQAFLQAELRRGTLSAGPAGHSGRRPRCSTTSRRWPPCALPCTRAGPPVRRRPRPRRRAAAHRLRPRRARGRRRSGRRPASSSYSTLAAKHRLAAWVRVLAAAATDPGRRTGADHRARAVPQAGLALDAGGARAAARGAAAAGRPARPRAARAAARSRRWPAPPTPSGGSPAPTSRTR
jgi:exodeoxyribonuclease V gamma subunit